MTARQSLRRLPKIISLDVAFLRDPRHVDGLIFGFVFRFVAITASIAAGLLLLILYGAVFGWHVTTLMLFFFACYISIMIFIVEHLRSQAYERLVHSKQPVKVHTSATFQGAENELGQKPISVVSLFAKRIFDIAFSSAALFTLFPIFLVVAIAIKMDSPGPLFYMQRRISFDGRDILIFKFRTTYRDVPTETAPELHTKVPHKSRITPVGRVLRIFNFDELPQFLNVLLGNMSIVGPRPLIPGDAKFFEDRLSKYALHQHVKPGITGWAQVHGYMHQENKSRSDALITRLNLDLWYIENWNFALDMKIILMTLIHHRSR